MKQGENWMGEVIKEVPGDKSETGE